MMGLGALGLVGQTTAPAERGGRVATAEEPGEKFPSADSLIWDFHPLGEVNGTRNLYRSASPVRDLEKKSSEPGADSLAEAKVRLRRMYDRGIRTIVSLEIAQAATQPADAGQGWKEDDKAAWMRLEREAAEAVGIRYVADPMANRGPGSLETLSDEQVKAWLDRVAADLFKYSNEGGVDFHCSAGHDRTGIVTAYLRIKYEHWSVDRAIQEMRDYGHNWPKFSNNGGVTSWHEAHLRGIARMMSH